MPVSASDRAKTSGLFCFLSGLQGIGKSTTAGTLEGRTLVFYAKAESHGPIQASRKNPLVDEECVDNIHSFMQWDTMLKMVGDDAAMAPYQNIVFDSLTHILPFAKMSPKFISYCKPDGKSYNHFREGEAMIHVMKDLIAACRKLSDAGKNIVFLCSLEGKQLVDGVPQFVPMISTYRVSEYIPGLFDQVLILDRVTDVDGVPDGVYICNTSTLAKKQQKDYGVREFQVNPRIMGIDNPPPYMEPNLQKLLDLARKG